MISAIVCAFRKNKTKGCFIRGCSWVLGLVLLSSAGNALRLMSPQRYQFADTQVAITAPDGYWKMAEASKGSDAPEILFSQDLSVAVVSKRISAIHSLADINSYSQKILGDQFEPAQRCNTEHFTCAHQETTVETSVGLLKDVDYFYLTDDKETVIITVITTPEKHEQNRQAIMAMINSVRSETR
ncbi:hypothetical protein [Pseudocitrobacter cyperus]|uniref:DUF1795 domain-containing protein n=1 Tax=Pseudocitrobacter cyperus TaxID=3112843 RepID=A0ABV0HQ00_9ENTR